MAKAKALTPISAEPKPDATSGNVEQGEEITRRAFDEDHIVNSGVGPQPDEHRGNMFGGFTEPEDQCVATNPKRSRGKTHGKRND